MLASIQILPATVADLPAIAELAAVSWRAHYPGIISREQIEYMLEQMYSLPTLTREVTQEDIAYDRILMARSSSGLRPTARASTPPKRPGIHRLRCGQARGQAPQALSAPALPAAGLRLGAARARLPHGRPRGYTALLLNVNKHNTKAIAAYQKNGFAIRESVCADIGGGFVMDDYVMAKSLVTAP